MTRVNVDVVEPGKALVTGPDFSGYVARHDNGRLYVEDTDSETFIGYANSYRKAGELLAKYHNTTDPHIEVDFER